ncbi:MAG: hypothetical protein NTZ60_01250 [Campylobacterales bacterium]|nr:hypothetical protein [Campylobacterales bacterium]
MPTQEKPSSYTKKERRSNLSYARTLLFPHAIVCANETINFFTITLIKNIQILSGRFSAAPTAGSFSIASANRGQDVLTAMVGGDITVAKYTKLFALVNANKRENEEGYTAMAGVKVGF